VELDLSDYEGMTPIELSGRNRFPRIGELPYLLTLAPRGFFWFLLRNTDDGPVLEPVDADKELPDVA
jgi:maltose alpha-D-glucosyltransferase/alpha-amylase